MTAKKSGSVLFSKEFWLGMAKSKTVQANLGLAAVAAISEGARLVIEAHPALSIWGTAALNLVLRAITKESVTEKGSD